MEFCMSSLLILVASVFVERQTETQTNCSGNPTLTTAVCMGNESNLWQFAAKCKSLR